MPREFRFPHSFNLPKISRPPLGLFIPLIGLLAILLLGLGLKGRKAAIPFAPFLASGALVSLLWGETILDWYLP